GGAPARWAFAGAARAEAPGDPDDAANMAGLAAARAEAPGDSATAAADMAGLAAARAEAPGDPATAAAAERPPAPFAEALRLRIALRGEERPLFIGDARPETVDALRSLLVVLRGSEAEAEAKPLAILQARAEPGQTWGREACRLITLGARRGLPLALAPAEPPGGPLPRNWTLRAAAAMVAATVIHQLARRRAPLAWALPLRHWFEGSETHRSAWRSLFAAADWLELPTIALLGGPPHSAAAEITAAAALAISARARLLVCAGGDGGGVGGDGGGVDQDGPDRRSVPEIFGRPRGHSPARGEGGRRTRGSATLPEEIEAALDRLVRKEAARCGVEASDLSFEAGDV
ncbi:MAG: hypothetical protein FJY75_09225, partial [Candidatus Eisenbacteria bacterium]|nr:hypothetical protein [Candidatus Eisenbacteria bacterium]